MLVGLRTRLTTGASASVLAKHGEVSLIVRPLTEEQENAKGGVGRAQALEEEEPGSGQVKATIRKRVLSGFVH